MATTTETSGTILGIRFCERCKGSIPESEFHDGRALHVGSKNIHVDCLLKRSAVLPVLCLVLALYAAGVATWLLMERGAKKEGDAGVSTAVKAEIERQVAASERASAAKVQEAVRAAADAKTALDASVAELRAAIQAGSAQGDAKVDAAVRAASAGIMDRLGKIEATLAAIDTRLKGTESLDGKFNSLAQAVTGLREQVAALKAQIPAPPPSTEGGGDPPK